MLDLDSEELRAVAVPRRKQRARKEKPKKSKSLFAEVLEENQITDKQLEEALQATQVNVEDITMRELMPTIIDEPEYLRNFDVPLVSSTLLTPRLFCKPLKLFDFNAIFIKYSVLPPVDPAEEMRVEKLMDLMFPEYHPGPVQKKRGVSSSSGEPRVVVTADVHAQAGQTPEEEILPVVPEIQITSPTEQIQVAQIEKTPHVAAPATRKRELSQSKLVNFNLNLST